jgi:plastocyanin/mono/diheme cytochrome c family protein
METSRNPGMYAVVAGVGLGVLFALLGIVGVLDTRVGLGLAVISFLVAALLYIFYMRGTAVSKTGYATVISILVIGLIIPLLTVTQQQQQADQAETQYDLTLHRGAALFGQYCAPCHNYNGQGLIGPQLNGEGGGVPPVYTLTDDEVTRTISGGVPDPSDITKYLMPAWLNTYGGPLTQDDISYLVALIRSSEPNSAVNKARAADGLPTPNGFNYVSGTLSQSQIATATALAAPTKPAASTFVDMTGKKTISIVASNDATGGTFHWAVAGGTTANIIVSVGTTVTWTNDSSVAHNVYSGYGTFQKVPAPDGFKSSAFTQGDGSFSFTYTAAGEYPFYCGIHPYMKGWITVK